ncbi:MAG: hypothetical protein Q8P92_04285 [Candidatus Daviesbacteria bacterium]|nr:hypothetical protein [Candidatus Daviesbacteria bacterium]
MNNLLKSIILIIFITVISITAVPTAMAGFLSIRLEEPKNPTNDNSFNITFVTLDTDSRDVVVKCFKKGPVDGGFSQFGADIALPAGGNSGDCQVDSTLMGSQGTYQFYVEAKADGDTATSSTVTVEYKTQAPANPYNFSKEKVGTCEYKIKFKTSNDSLTHKVEIYMSSFTSFSADSGTKVGEVGIGSDQEGEFTTSISDCNKTYYFVIRAFDDAGNGSGLVGDSNTNVITKEVQVAGPVTVAPAGAIPVSGATGGEILGVSGVSEGVATEEGQVLGEEGLPSAEKGVEGEVEDEAGLLTGRNLLLLLIAIILIGGVYLYRKSK